MNETNWLMELVKLALSLAGALLVAKFAVKWALDRYKAEKTWERRLAAYTDALQSLSHLRRIGLEYDEEFGSDSHRTSDYVAERGKKWRLEMDRLCEATAIAQLILSSDASSLLSKLERDLRTSVPDYLDIVDHNQRQIDAIDVAVPKLVKAARKELLSNSRASFVASGSSEAVP